MILDIKPLSEKLLYEKMATFDFKNPPINPIELANNLIETMHHNKGLGLSANQCGLPYRVFVLWSEKPLVCFNPRIVDQTSEGVLMEEGCLSYPHLHIKIRRPKVIKVRFADVTGEIQNETFVGMTARCFLHELDHLDGVVFTRRAMGPHLSRALNQQKQLERQFKRGEVRYKESELPIGLSDRLVEKLSKTALLNPEESEALTAPTIDLTPTAKTISLS
jgi:peptide deformylase